MLETKLPDLQQLGVLGILKESLRIGRACSRVLALIAVFLLLPLNLLSSSSLARSSLKQHLISLSQLLLLKMYVEPLQRSIANGNFTDLLETQPNFLQDVATGSGSLDYSDWPSLLLQGITYEILFMVFSLFSTAAVVYTVASFYAQGRKRCSVKLLSILGTVLRIWGRLVATYLWCSLMKIVADTGSFALGLLPIQIWTALSSSAIHMLKSPPLFLLPFWLAAFVIVMVLWFLVSMAAKELLSVVWNMATVVSVAEESFSSGLGAIRKALNLLRRKALLTFLLALIYAGFDSLVTHGLERSVVGGDAGVWRRALTVAAEVLLNLGGLLVLSVLFYVCESVNGANAIRRA